jgi:aminodeoxychorismate synthase component I
MFIIQNQDRFLVGRKVAREWKAMTMEEAEQFLEEIRAHEGWKFGYLSYDFGVKWQGVEQEVMDDLVTPLLHFVAFDEVEELEEMPQLEAGNFDGMEASPNMKKSDYMKAIESIHQYLKNGETYEVNFAQRFSGEFGGDPARVFQKLHEANPSPYACFLPFDSVTVVSNSPERLVYGRMKDGKMILESRPIKGTMPRGKNPEEDKKMIERLLASSKNEAELNMIVDLVRNDMGRVCEVGSVEVTDHREIETYSHVHHTMSNVRGVMKDNLDWVDVLKALFPGGSITGAPKIRTMEIIDHLEPIARGIYTGSAGWISPEGEFDFNILIRTIAFQKEQGRYAYHSGGGIVIDSEAQDEYEETLHKAQALLQSLSQA